MKPSTQELRDRLAAALAEVTFAEDALGIALKALHGGPRAEKVKVTDVIESAFERLRSGRAELAKLRELVEVVASSEG